MTAKVNLTRGREPAKRPTLFGLTHKGRFGEVVFACDGTHQRIGKPFVHHTDGCLIAREHFFGKGVNNILLNCLNHLDLPSSPLTPSLD